MAVDTTTATGNATESIDAWLTRFGAFDADAAALLVDRHDPAAVAFVLAEARDGQLSTTNLTYGDIADRSRRLATGLAQRGLRQGDTVGVLMGKRAELVISLIAIARLGAVYIPLFTAFATPAIDMRLVAGRARMVIADENQASKVDGLDIDTIVTGDEFDALVATSEPLEHSVAVGGEAPLILLFTSGTTGTPKGVLIPVKALAAFSCFMIYGLDVQVGDTFWNAADPGWAYGLYYGILGPMAIGCPNILLSGEFSPQVTAQVLEQCHVTNFTSVPTVYRVLSKDPTVTGFNLRRASAAGEPLTPDVLQWSSSALGTEVHDMYGQTEHGMFINNHWHDALQKPVAAGSMGFTMPGFTTGIVNGQIAIDVARSPLMFFSGYLDAPEATAARFTGDGSWYLTGDVGRVDHSGRYFFQARDDDVIIMAGYRIGPFDIESVLIAHPSVADVAVVGRPDDLRGEVVEAFVVLSRGAEGGSALEKELQQLVKTEFAAHAYPRVIHFVDSLPRTPSGKIQRYILRS